MGNFLLHCEQTRNGHKWKTWVHVMLHYPTCAYIVLHSSIGYSLGSRFGGKERVQDLSERLTLSGRPGPEAPRGGSFRADQELDGAGVRAPCPWPGAAAAGFCFFFGFR